jgi:hypothetical protein
LIPRAEAHDCSRGRKSDSTIKCLFLIVIDTSMRAKERQRRYPTTDHVGFFHGRGRGQSALPSGTDDSKARQEPPLSNCGRVTPTITLSLWGWFDRTQAHDFSRG